MSKKLKRTKQNAGSSSFQPNNLQSIFRSQIVQQYPYSRNNFHFPFQHSENIGQYKQQSMMDYQDDLLEGCLNGSDIVQGYQDFPSKPEQKQQVKFRGQYNYVKQSMQNESFDLKKEDINYLFDRPASRSSDGEDILKNLRQNSLDKLPFIMQNCREKQAQMDIEIDNFPDFRDGVNNFSNKYVPFNELQRDIGFFDQRKYVQRTNFDFPNTANNFQKNYSPNCIFINNLYENRAIQAQKSADQLLLQNKERQDKIAKIQKIGCKCRKSKCLKMYCQCFHLQIYCNQNCDCVGCGNMQQTNDHKQAVIEALTRNPKAFIDVTENIDASNGTLSKQFKIGVETSEIKKGCKCKKTKCRKKYCQCYNSKIPCGIFCKCQGCENNKCDH